MDRENERENERDSLASQKRRGGLIQRIPSGLAPEPSPNQEQTKTDNRMHEDFPDVKRPSRTVSNGPADRVDRIFQRPIISVIRKVGRGRQIRPDLRDPGKMMDGLVHVNRVFVIKMERDIPARRIKARDRCKKPKPDVFPREKITVLWQFHRFGLHPSILREDLNFRHRQRIDDESSTQGGLIVDKPEVCVLISSTWMQ